MNSLLVQDREQAKKWGRVVARAWEDEDFKRRLVSHPAAVLSESGIDVPLGVEPRVVEAEAEEEIPGVVHFTLPPKPGSEDLIE